jgi:hypothetical protein
MIVIGGRSMERSPDLIVRRAGAALIVVVALAVAALTAACGSRSVLGTGCGGNLTDCNGDCVSLADDPAHCGSCGVSCNAVSICGGGNCNPCPAGQSACDNRCFDLQTDPTHCGTCPTLCATGHACVGGLCQ